MAVIQYDGLALWDTQGNWDARDLIVGNTAQSLENFADSVKARFDGNS